MQMQMQQVQVCGVRVCLRRTCPPLGVLVVEDMLTRKAGTAILIASWGSWPQPPHCSQYKKQKKLLAILLAARCSGDGRREGRRRLTEILDYFRLKGLQLLHEPLHVDFTLFFDLKIVRSQSDCTKKGRGASNFYQRHHTALRLRGGGKPVLRFGHNATHCLPSYSLLLCRGVPLQEECKADCHNQYDDNHADGHGVVRVRGVASIAGPRIHPFSIFIFKDGFDGCMPSAVRFVAYSTLLNLVRFVAPVLYFTNKYACHNKPLCKRTYCLGNFTAAKHWDWAVLVDFACGATCPFLVYFILEDPSPRVWATASAWTAFSFLDMLNTIQTSVAANIKHDREDSPFPASFFSFKILRVPGLIFKVWCSFLAGCQATSLVLLLFPSDAVYNWFDVRTTQ